MNNEFILITSCNLKSADLIVFKNKTYVVEKTMGYVSCHKVAGAFILKDFFATIRDFFGGISKSFDSSLSRGKEELEKELTAKALLAGGNAIINYKIDVCPQAGNSMTQIHGTGEIVYLKEK